MRQGRLIYNIILTGLFFLFIGIPLSINLILKVPEKKISFLEKRMLAERPEFDLSMLDPFPGNFEKYYNDHFPYRDELISFYSHALLYTFFNKSPLPAEVVIGKDKWLYSTGKEKEVYEGTYPLSPDEVAEIAKTLHERALFLKSLGIKFYIAIAPMKCEIYPEHLPAFYTRNVAGTITDHILDKLRQDTLLNLIELKDTLLANKKNGVLYYQTDNHWNGLGAYFVYKTILCRMKKDFPMLQLLRRTDITLKGWRFRAGNLAGLAGLYSYMKEMIFYPIVNNPKALEEKKTGYLPPKGFGYPSEYELVRSMSNTRLPNILVIRDSFFTPLVPLFSENFHRSVYLFDAWKYGLNKDVLLKEKPDVVLLEVFEPHLANLIKNH